MRFKSKTKHKVLNLLFLKPRRSFSVNELAVRTGSTVSRVAAILPEFLKQHLVTITQRQRVRCCQINKRSSQWEELGRLFGSSRPTSRGSTDPIKRLICSLPRLKFAALAGIYIGRPAASVDVLLVGDISEGRLQRVIRQLEELHGGEINYALFSESEFEERVYSYDWFVKEVLDHDPIVLVDRLKRRPTKGEKYLKTVFSKVNG